ncbi:hypothetical protein ACN2XU_21110 [Primorskyibacter sp. 2E107]|uniref:hypothetical protein n=1 Tax=Primorskyibacter sp. 2E107 TaxID=3403458 RepID=UPI003AF6D909
MSDFPARADRLRQDLRDAQARHLAAETALHEAGKALADLVEEALQSALRCDVPVTDHRREYRMGRHAKLDTDPELSAFVRAPL